MTLLKSVFMIKRTLENMSLSGAATGGALYEKVFLEISQKFTGKYLCQSLFFNGVAGLLRENLG